MPLEKLLISNSDLGVSKGLCRDKLNNSSIGFYDQIKAKSNNGAGLISLEGNLAVDGMETFFAAYQAVKQKLSQTSVASLGTQNEAIGIYSLFVASSYAHASLTKHIDTESSYSELTFIQDADDENLALNSLARNFVIGTMNCRNGKELVERTKGYFTQIKSITQGQLSSGAYGSLMSQLKNIEIQFEGDLKAFNALNEKKKRKSGKKKDEKPDKIVTFKDVGGNHEVKSQLTYLVRSLNHPDRDKYGYKPPRGIFFYGIPGTGKTLIAKALANECGMEFHRIDLSGDIVSKWYGDTEKNLKEALYQKGLIFLDEYDSIGRKASGDGYGEEMSTKIVNIIAEAMDGYDANEDAIYIASSNTLRIDRKLKRAGRFDEFYEFKAPDVQETEEILMIHLGGLQKKVGAGIQLFDGVDTGYISQALYQRSLEEQKQNSDAAIVGADIAEICRRVHKTQWNQFLDTNSFNRINSGDFIREIQNYSLKERFSDE